MDRIDRNLFHLSCYDYPLKKEAIAQYPPPQREDARLAVIRRSEGMPSFIHHEAFEALIQYLEPEDLLVLNNSRVSPARIFASKVPSNGKVEMLLLRRLEPAGDSSQWEVLIQGSVRSGTHLMVNGTLEIIVRDRMPGGLWRVEVNSQEPFADLLDRIGQTPLPPYIRRIPTNSDRERYQTVFAQSKQTSWEKGGSVAAPTAGLHFTQSLLNRMVSKGVNLAYITLNIGIGTFRPVRAADIRDHRMHAESFVIPRETADLISRTRLKGGRVFAVGTSTTRALEAAARGGEPLQTEGETDLFIYPGFDFKIVQALITNFHFPKSTLFMLISAFAGLDRMRQVYEQATRLNYRFMSYGDAMLIL